MIYRVHQPHKPNGSLGKFVGYVNLCNGYINIKHICDSLAEAKLVPERWFVHSELQTAAAASNVPGAHTYTVVRRGHRTHIFFLQPVMPKEYYSNVSPNTFTVTGELGNYNIAQYIVSQPIAVADGAQNLAVGYGAIAAGAQYVGQVAQYVGQQAAQNQAAQAGQVIRADVPYWLELPNAPINGDIGGPINAPVQEEIDQAAFQRAVDALNRR